MSRSRLFAQRGEHEHPLRRELPRHEAQQRQRGGVCPLQIVDHQQPGSPGTGRSQAPVCRVEQREAGKLAVSGTVLGRSGEQPLGQLDRGRQVGFGLGDLPPQLHPWPEGRRATLIPARRPRHTRALPLSQPGHLPGQPGLADPGLTGHHHQPAAAGHAQPQRVRQLSERLVAPDQRVHGVRHVEKNARPVAGAGRGESTGSPAQRPAEQHVEHWPVRRGSRRARRSLTRQAGVGCGILRSRGHL